MTISFWIKRAYIGEEAIIGNTNSGSNWAMFYFDGANRLQFASYISGSYVMRYTTSRKFNDIGAWMHLVATVDVSLSSPEVKIYVNGEEQTNLEYNVTPSQNADIGWFNAWNFEIGVMFGSSYYFRGCLADLYYIQGYIYPASTFGESDSVSGIWKPLTSPTINYGGNGGNSCHLKFENSGNMDLDSGSNNISFTTSGTLTQNVDNPSNNFATMNPLDAFYFGAVAGTNFKYGNLRVTSNNSSYTYCSSTFHLSSGKFYCEVKAISGSSVRLGIGNKVSGASSDNLGNDTDGEAILYRDGNIKVNNTDNPNSWSGTSWTDNDIIGIALDLENAKLYFSKNGTFMNSANPANGTNGITITAPASTTGGGYFIGWGDNDGGGTATMEHNFGQGYFGITQVASAGTSPSGGGIFEYDCPSGFQAWCTKGINSF